MSLKSKSRYKEKRTQIVLGQNLLRPGKKRRHPGRKRAPVHSVADISRLRRYAADVYEASAPRVPRNTGHNAAAADPARQAAEEKQAKEAFQAIVERVKMSDRLDNTMYYI